MIIENNFIPGLAGKISGMEIAAVTIGIFVFIASAYKDDKTIINHENIHVAQYKELWFFGFFAVYAWDFIVGYLRFKSWELAYHSIRLEKEAYAKQGNDNYLETRKKYYWMKQ